MWGIWKERKLSQGHKRKGALGKQPSFSWNKKAKGISREKVKGIEIDLLMAGVGD